MEGRRLLQELDAVANRVRRVSTGWESELTLAIDDAMARRAVFDLMEAFYAEPRSTAARPAAHAAEAARGGAGRHLGGAAAWPGRPGHRYSGAAAEQQHPLRAGCGELEFVFCVAPHHPLADLPEPLSAAQIAEHRIIAVADSARTDARAHVGLLPGQDVLTVPSMAIKLEAQMRGLGCGSLPEPLVRRHIEAGRLVRKATYEGRRAGRMHYAWRDTGQAPGKALAWWLEQLAARPRARRCSNSTKGAARL
jgi:DNA-binding transcriptional LysR family regulator